MRRQKDIINKYVFKTKSYYFELFILHKKRVILFLVFLSAFEFRDFFFFIYTREHLFVDYLYQYERLSYDTVLGLFYAYTHSEKMSIDASSYCYISLRVTVSCVYECMESRSISVGTVAVTSVSIAEIFIFHLDNLTSEG